jgi:hypothetical protein
MSGDHIPASLRMDLTVPMGRSFFGCGTAKVLPVLGDHHMRWLPLPDLAGSHPAAFSSLIRSEDFTVFS